MLSKNLLSPKERIFMLHKLTNLFLIGKNVLSVRVPILINKDVFEPSYNDLKITVQNCSYFSTNLTAQKETLQGKAGEHHGQNITAESKWMKICKKTGTWGYQQRFGKKHGGKIYE